MQTFDTASRPGGLYYLADGSATDAHGNVIEGAPKAPKATPAHMQPGYVGPDVPAGAALPSIGGALLVTPEQLKQLIAAEVAKGAGKNAAKSSESETEQSDELPKIADLDEHLQSLTSAAEVKALQKRDERVTAGPMYEARLAELKQK
jgi:hypothetical protein